MLSALIHLTAQELTIGHTSYVPQRGAPAEATTYIQPHYTSTLLGSIATANHAVLSKLSLTQQHDLPFPVPAKITLDKFAQLGASDPEIAWPVYQALMAELTAPSRPPILYALDAFNHIMRESAYLSPDVSPIHAHDLALVKHFLSLLSAKTALPNGGMVIASESNSNRPMNPALDFAIERNQAVADGKEVPEWDAYRRIDSRVLQAMEGVDVWQLKGLSKDEARGIMEYYARSGMLRRQVTNALVSEKWTLAGHGIVGEIERGSVMMSI